MTSFVRLTKDNFSFYQGSVLEIETVSFPSPWPLQSFEKEIDNPVSYLYGLVFKDVLIGYICYWEFTGEYHLMNIAVRPDERGKGYGGLLLEKMIENGTANEVKKAWLEVRPSNLSAIGLYERAGFKEVGLRPGYYADTKEDAIIMALPIGHQEPQKREGDKKERLGN
ncbi:ribosomal protein S18-alanine N-acetyltransferase [Thermodesulfobacteriota bacterium]